MIESGRFLALLLLPMAFVAQGDVDKTRQAEILYLLRHDCGSCHGMTLQGGLGPALTTKALQGKSREYLKTVILSGRPGTPMPPWRPFLKTEEVQWLVDQLKSGDLDREND